MAAADGERNATLNRETFGVAQLVPGGYLTEDQVREAMTAAGLAVGDEPAKVKASVNSGLRDGQRNPREIRLEDRSRGAGRRRRGRAPLVSAPAPKPHPAPEQKPRRVPREQLRALWRAGRPVDYAPDGKHPTYEAGVRYLARRGFDLADVAYLDLVRILPEQLHRWPKWWPWGRAGAWTIGALLYEPNGTPASIQARAVELEGQPKPDPKSRNPKGYEIRNLLFADPAGVAMLRGNEPAPSTVLLAEGLTDTIALSLFAYRRPEHIAVLGVIEGGAAALAGVKWTPGQVVVCFTDTDPAGDKYAAAALAALPEKVTMQRARIPNAQEG